MRSESLEFRIPVYRLLIMLLVTVVPISIAGLYSLSQSDRSLRATIGSHFKAIAGSTAAEVSQFIHERVTDVGELAAEPRLVEAVAAANKSYLGMSDAAVVEKFQRIDKIWNTPAADPAVKEILSSPVSRWLRRFRELDPRILRITVTDAKGATIAATQKTADYYQADEEYWQNIYAQGRGALSLTDILYDEVTKANYIGIGVPVLEEGSSQFIGTVDALVDVSVLSSVVYRSPFAPMGRILLVKDDGTVIAAPQVTLSMNLKSEEHAAVQDVMGTLAGRQAGYVVAGFRGGGSQLIGFADTGLKQDYRNLGWAVLVCQDTGQAFAAVRLVDRLIAFMSVLGLAMVTLVVAYFALHRKLPFTEIGRLAHEPVAPSGKETGSPASEEAPIPARSP